MNSEEIRKTNIYCLATEDKFWLKEIAFQLALMNEFATRDELIVTNQPASIGIADLDPNWRKGKP